jgi:membrane protein implicated in regulation of membrane protease activity
MRSVLGSIGRIVTATQGPRGAGEVNLGGRLYFAWSTRPLSAGTRVMVVDARPGARSVQVEPWVGE